jgi:hypothetical protein
LGIFLSHNKNKSYEKYRRGVSGIVEEKSGYHRMVGKIWL